MFKKTFKEYAKPMIIRSIFGSIMNTADRTIAAIFIGGLGAYVGLLIRKKQSR